MKKSTKIIRLSVTLLLLIAMLLTPMSPVFAVVIENGDADLTAADIVSEDASKREKFSRHYLTGDGTYFAVSYAEQVNYQDEDGNWIAVDNSLSTNVLTGEKTTKNDKFKVKFANKANYDDLVTIKTKEYDVSFGITVSEDGESYLELNKVKGTESASNTSEEPKTTQEATSLGKAVSGITYVDAFSDYLDVRYTVAHEKVKEDLILERKSGFNSYKVTYNIKEKDALATLNDDGSITFTNPDGAVLFNVGVPVMYDSDGKSSADIAVSMIQTKKTVEVTYTPNSEWLDAEDRVYPVTIDPTTQSGTYDGNYWETAISYSSSEPAENPPYGNSPMVSIYQDQSYYLHIFDVPTIPVGATVNGTDLVLYASEWIPTEDSDVFYINRLTSYWAPGEIIYEDNTTNYPTKDATFSVSCSENIIGDSAPYRFDLSIIGASGNNYSSYFSSSSYYGFEVTLSSGYATIYSGFYSTASLRPAIIVRYSTSSSPNIISGNLYHIVSNTGDYLTISGDGYTVPSNPTLSVNTANAMDMRQMFKITYNTYHGTYKITPYADTSNYFLKSNYDPSTGGFSQHDAVMSTGAFEWVIIDRNNGKFSLHAANYVGSAISLNGITPIITNYSSSDSDQNWSFAEVSNQYDATTDQVFYLDIGEQLFRSNYYSEFDDWDSDNLNVATVSQTGRIYAHEAGKAVITTPFNAQITVYVLFPDGVYYFDNKEYSKVMQIDDDSELTAFGAFFELHDYDGEDYQKWRITHIGTRYYKITSEASQLAATAPSNKNDKITQNTYTDLSTQQWTIDYAGSGAYKLSPRSNPNYYLAAGEGILTANGRNVEMRDEQDDNKDEWELIKVQYTAHVFNYYDMGYPVRYGESSSVASSKIESYLDMVAEQYSRLFDLNLTTSNPTYYHSPIDVCKGTVNSSNIDYVCAHAGVVHTERSNVISDFNSSHTGDSKTTHVLWSCHRISSRATNGHLDYNRSCSSGTGVFMLEISSSNRERNSQGILMHELNHQYGADDHYHELENINDPNSCKHKEICSDCGDIPRPSSCIMNQSRIDISNDDVICAACKNDILTHLKDHHSN